MSSSNECDNGFFTNLNGVDECAQTIQNILDQFEASEEAIEWYIIIEKVLYDYIQLRANRAKDDTQELSYDVMMGVHDRVRVTSAVLSDAISRTFRRALYCKCFNEIGLTEMKIAGLVAYWIIKLHPIIVQDFIVQDINSIGKGIPSVLGTTFDDINEQLAAHIILSTFTEKFGDISLDYDEYRIKLIHALRYRVHTENSMMLLAESIGQEAFL
jgi:hypothetical protein